MYVCFLDSESSNCVRSTHSYSLRFFIFLSLAFEFIANILNVAVVVVVTVEA